MQPKECAAVLPVTDANKFKKKKEMQHRRKRQQLKSRRLRMLKLERSKRAIQRLKGAKELEQ